MKLLVGDVLDKLAELPDESVQCVVTSPPYWGLRDYGIDGQLGLEATPDEYVEKMVSIFRQVRRVLRSDGTVWLNLGDSYASTNAGNRNGLTKTLNQSDKREGALKGKNGNQYRALPPGLKTKDLVGIPWRVAFALQADGWYLRQDIIWHKPNPMPESVRDRCTKAHEYIFLLSKSAKYYYDHEIIKEDTNPKNYRKTRSLRNAPGQTPDSGFTNGRMYKKRNRRSVWSITTKCFKGAHFATFPPDLIEPCILAGCPEGGVVLDPFMGAGTTALVAQQHGRECIGIELNPEYAEIARKRLL